MGIASMVIGIIAAVLSFVPFCNTFAIIPALVGLILGIVAAVQASKKQQPKGMAVAGIVCNAVAIGIIVLFWCSLLAAPAAAMGAAGL